VAEDLRRVMYRPGAGTWFGAELTVTRHGSMDADFNYDDEPQWSRPVEPAWYAQDLEKFPRDESAPAVASRPAGPGSRRQLRTTPVAEQGDTSLNADIVGAGARA
jgi:hypothetical protein